MLIHADYGIDLVGWHPFRLLVRLRQRNLWHTIVVRIDVGPHQVIPLQVSCPRTLPLTPERRVFSRFEDNSVQSGFFVQLAEYRIRWVLAAIELAARHAPDAGSKLLSFAALDHEYMVLMNHYGRSELDFRHGPLNTHHRKVTLQVAMTS